MPSSTFIHRVYQRKCHSSDARHISYRLQCCRTSEKYVRALYACNTFAQKLGANLDGCVLLYCTRHRSRSDPVPRFAGSTTSLMVRLRPRVWVQVQVCVWMRMPRRLPEQTADVACWRQSNLQPTRNVLVISDEDCTNASSSGPIQLLS